VIETLPLAKVLQGANAREQLQQGWSPQCESTPASDGSWGVLKTTAIQAGAFLPHENKQLPAALSPRPHLEVHVGDVLLTCAGPRSRCGVPTLVRATPSRLMLSGKMYRFRPDPAILDPRYLELCLLSPRSQAMIDQMKTGISDSGLNLTKQRFLDLPIPIVSLHEQQRIVEAVDEYLSRLDAAQCLLEGSVRRAERLSASHARRLIARSGGQSAGFSEVFETLSDNGVRVAQRDYLPAGPLPVVDQGAALIGGYTTAEHGFAGPLPVVIFGDHTRRAKYVDFPFAVGAQGIKILRAREGVDPRYAYHLVAQANLSARGYGRHLALLRALQFPLPDFVAQRQIATRIDELNASTASLQDVLQRNMRRAETLRSSLLTAATSGLLPQSFTNRRLLEEFASV
jgi:type I restriction enzyme, S subunit